MKRILSALAFLTASSSIVAGSAPQGTVTVDTVEDTVDFGGAQTLASLPGPDGLVSFREAIIATNNSPGPQTVAFAIPQSGWWLFTNIAALKLENGVFFVTDDGTTLDFTTQTAFTGNTNPNGTEVGIYGLEPNGLGTPAIVISADNCVVRGLGTVRQRGASVSIGGGTGNRIVGCVTEVVKLDPFPGTTSFNVIGGTNAGDGNVIDSVDITCGADDNLVIGNILQSVSIRGSQYCTIQYPQRNRIGGPTAAERNVISGAGSYGFEGSPTGFNVQVLWSQDTVVEGNYVGVTADGLTRVPQIAPSGIEVFDSINTTIRNNLVAGMRVVGINHFNGQVFGEAIQIGALNADNLGTVIEGNTIGTDVTGLNPLVTLNGIEVIQFVGSRVPRGTRIGGIAPGQGNRIAFVQRTGVSVLGNITDTEISGNSIRESGLLGIDLGTLFQGVNGVTPNDPGDPDTGSGNEYQNFPIVTAARVVGAGMRIQGTLNTRPFGSYRIEFFANTQSDPSGNGEGERFLDSVVVSTDQFGNASYDELVMGSFAPFVTATATDLSTRATSEFGPSAMVRAKTDRRRLPRALR